ncbi:Hypothetical protein SCF082_LOCUS33763 [Durusdinium trenchii]|uniref:Pentatricopeptide repeat-containing protein n=1 Tax=Durusdinium trenchii TaxID=1381693 RepID=A0ABP0NTW4_9DINO
MARWTRALGRGPLEVEELLRSMRSSQVEINDFHQCTAMSSYTKSSAWPRALRTVGVSSDAARANAALRAWAAGGSWAAAISFLSDLKDLKTDTISFNSSMAALSHAPHWPQVLELLRWMQHEGLLPSAVSLHYAVGMASWASALALLEGMRGVRRTEVTCLGEEEMGGWPMRPMRPWIYTPIVGASFTEVHGSARRFARRAEEKVPHVAVAVLLRWLLRRWPLAVGFLEAAQWSPSLLSQEGRNAALSLVASCGRWALALHAALHAAADVVSRSESCAGSAVGGGVFGGGGTSTDVGSLTDGTWLATGHSMADKGFSTAISACEQAGRWQLTWMLLELMWDRKVKVNNFSYNAAA